MLPPLKAAQYPQLHGGVWQRSSPSTGGTEICVVDHREDFRSLEGIFKQLLYHLGVPFWPGHNPHSLWRIQAWALEAAEQNSEYYMARQGHHALALALHTILHSLRFLSPLLLLRM